MRRVILIIVAIGFLLLLIVRSSPSRVSAARLVSAGPVQGDPCAATERCIAVYVAPWCGACRAAGPLIRELRAHVRGTEGRVGMKIIVGRDNEERLREYATELGADTFLDADDTFYRDMRVRGVPTWWVWNREGQILTQFSGYLTGAPMPELLDAMIDQRLALKEFM